MRFCARARSINATAVVSLTPCTLTAAVVVSAPADVLPTVLLTALMTALPTACAVIRPVLSTLATAGLLDVQATAPGACMAHIAPWPPTVRLTRAGNSLKSLAVGGDGGCAASGGLSLFEPPPQADSPRHSVRATVSHKLSPHRPACEVPFIVARAAMAQARAPRRCDHSSSAARPAVNSSAGCGSGTGAR